MSELTVVSLPEIPLGERTVQGVVFAGCPGRELMELRWQPDPEKARLERAALSRFLGIQLQELFDYEPHELAREFGGDLVHPVTTSTAYAKKNGTSLSLSKQAMVQAVLESRSRAEKAAADGLFAVDLMPLSPAAMAATIERHVDTARRLRDTSAPRSCCRRCSAARRARADRRSSCRGRRAG